MPVQCSTSLPAKTAQRPGDPCIMVIFGASGDLTKRLLMPAIYNLACGRQLSNCFAIVGMAMSDWTSEQFRDHMSKEIRTFSTRPQFDEAAWNNLVSRLHYTQGKFDDPAAFQKLAQLIDGLKQELQTENVLFYLAVPPPVFAMVSQGLAKVGLSRSDKGWRRIVVEKPFGADLESAIALNRTLLTWWTEEQIYRIDHYLGKETVQNIVAFRFANSLFESLWNRSHVDHIQFTVTESVGVESRGGYYDKSGVLRDMVQNHMFQMLAYICMEPPGSFKPDAIRNEKVKLLEAIRVMELADVPHNVVRGQYAAGKRPDGTEVPDYRKEKDVNPESNTETFVAMKLNIDNWRWDGVPVYLRSGKSLWKKGTEIIIEFKKAPEVLFRGTAVEHLEPNRLIFHIQPDQGIEVRFQSKIPGAAMELQDVNMRFNYSDTFHAVRGTGYEVLVYDVMVGDVTLFSRTDLVETAWRVVQPLLDDWKADKPSGFPNYPAGSWGPRAAFELIERDGRKWVEVINREVLQAIPLFHNIDPIFLNNLLVQLRSVVYGAGETIFQKGDPGDDMFILCRGQVDVLDDKGQVASTLEEGCFFGEIALLLKRPRLATLRARTDCDLFTLHGHDFRHILDGNPDLLPAILASVKERYRIALTAEELAQLQAT